MESSGGGLDGVGDSRLRDDDFGFWEALFDFLLEPSDGVVVSVDKEGFFRADFDDVVGDVFAGGVATEVKDAHFAMEGDGWVGGV